MWSGLGGKDCIDGDKVGALGMARQKTVVLPRPASENCERRRQGCACTKFTVAA